MQSSAERLRVSEERLRLVIESARDFAIFAIGLDERIETWNTGAERLFGWTEAEAVGQHASLIFTPEDREHGRAEQEIREAHATGRAEDERWHVRKDQSRFYASGVLAAVERDGRISGYVKIARDLTERKRLEDELQRTNEELERRVVERTAALNAEVEERRAAEEQIKALFTRLVSTQEAERHRIARELHDQLGQPMSALRINLEALRNRLSGQDQAIDAMERIQRLTEELDQRIAYLTWELRPASLDRLGLPAVLEELVGDWSTRFGVPARFEAMDVDGLRLADDVEVNVYRLTQEALHNIHKHAGATRASVLVHRFPDRVTLVIEDDGRGFDPAAALQGAGGFGLINMRERAALIGGELEIDTAPGRGTSVLVHIPLPRRMKQDAGG